MKYSFVHRATLLLFLLATVWFSFYIIQPPAPAPSSVSATEFSAERAFTHVQNIAVKPRPLGSAENDSARTYILHELEKLGLNATVQEGVAARGGRVAGYTKNILGRLPGTESKETIVLMAHYDSVPNSPGAADDASGVAAILEVVRAVQAQQTSLKNDVLVVLTDGEERGLLGAKLFVEHYKNLEDISLVINFEARGSSGPSMMFETSSPNAKLIRHFANATKYPVANSLMYTVYKILPNDTDLSVIKNAGLKGLNFAFAEDFLNYHTMQDTPENLSKASLQHHGSHMLNNVRHFGNIDFSLDSSTEFVYFNNFTGGLLYYPSGWSLPLAAVTAILFIAFLVYLFRTSRLSLGTYLGSLLLFLGMILLAAIGTWLGWQGIKALHPQYQWLAQGDVYDSIWYLWGFTLFNIGIFSAVYSWGWIRKYLDMHQLLAGPHTFWIALSLVTAWYLPTASYIFTWPALLALVGWVVITPKIESYSWKSTAVLMLSLVAVLFMIPPYIYLVQVMLTTEMLAICMVLAVLILGLIWPLLQNIMRGYQAYWNSLLILAAAACFITASANSGYNASHKKQNSISYFQNMGSGASYWVSGDHKTDSWTGQFLGKGYRTGDLPNSSLFGDSQWLYRKAKELDIPAPEFEILSDSTTDSLRHISLRMDVHQPGIGFRMEWSESIRNIKIHGKNITSPADGDSWRGGSNQIYYFQNLAKPVLLDLVLTKNFSDGNLAFIFTKMDLPTHLISNYEERKPFMMPTPNQISDATLWKTSINIGNLLK